MPDSPSTDSSNPPTDGGGRADRPEPVARERVAPTGQTRFRFRARYRGLSISAVALGLVLTAAAVFAGIDSVSRTWALVTGVVGVVLGATYFLSPAWRLTVVVDDQALAVVAASAQRFRLPWDEVVGVLFSPETNTCFVDGGVPARSLLVPGPGASAPYQIDDRAALCAHILAHVDAERVTVVDLLERAKAAAKAGEDEASPS